MKKQILNLGKGLNKAEQKAINGGQLLLCQNMTNPSAWECTYEECRDRGGIWYDCNQSCHQNTIHWPPC